MSTTMDTLSMPVIATANRSLCTHDAYSAHHTIASPYDDHVTEAGQCRDCLSWLVRVTWLTSREIEHRPMDAAEIAWLQKIDDQYRLEDAS